MSNSTNKSNASPQIQIQSQPGDRLLQSLAKLESAINDIEGKLSIRLSASDQRLATLEKQLGEMQEKYANLNDITDQVAGRLDQSLETLRKLASA